MRGAMRWWPPSQVRLRTQSSDFSLHLQAKAQFQMQLVKLCSSAGISILGARYRPTQSVLSMAANLHSSAGLRFCTY